MGSEFTQARRTLRLLPPPAEGRAELLGELGDWLHPSFSSSDGSFSVDVPLGAYEYKFRVGGAWVLSEDGARTRSRHGCRNHILARGATAEPLLFAPVAPFVYAEPRGGLRLFAALRHGAGETLRCGFGEGEHELTWMEMRPWLREDEHLVFVAHLPTSTSRVRLGFELSSGRRVLADEDGAALLFQAPSSTRVPDRWTSGLCYTVLVDRFRGVADDGWPAWRAPLEACGGHLEGVTRSLDALAELGVSVLHLTPVHRGEHCHRYDVVDPLVVDPMLGGSGALARLIGQARARGIDVLIDLSFSHVGERFGPWQDVVARGERSAHHDWFLWEDGQAPRRVRRYAGSGGPMLDLTHPSVQGLVLRAVDFWCNFEIGGLRLDGAAEVPLDLAVAVRELLNARRPGAVVLAELVPPHAFRWHRARALDVATEFGFQSALRSLMLSASPSVEAFALGLRELDLMRGAPPATSLRFLSTHDHPRLASLLARAFPPDEARRRLELALGLLLTLPGIPALVYGEELGLATPVAEHVPEDVWENRMPMSWRPTPAQEALRRFVGRLAALRRSSRALAEGTLEVLFAEGGLLVFRRRAGDDVMDVALNLRGEAAAFSLDEPRRSPGLKLAVGEAERRGTSYVLGPWSAAVFARGGERARSPAWDRAVRSRRDSDFERGLEHAAVLPTRLNFALTERCNLRCQHCITFAPVRTLKQTARAMTPFVLDQLRDELAHVQTFGFVHGGESLLSPLFYEVMSAIQAAREGLATQVHLLTNGALLTDHVLQALMERGLTSLSVSLDGATAETNDWLRVGGALDRVLEGVERAIQLRRRAGWRLVVGVSTVVTRHNLDELEQLARILAAVGADWLKLEELVPVNAVARSLLPVEPPEALASRTRAVAQLARGLGLVVVEHMGNEPQFRCLATSDPAVARFFEADGFANGAEMNPCRLPWELACVQPDGDVHLGDFFGPRLGNIAEGSLESLWNGRVAREERRRFVARRICAGRVSCVELESIEAESYASH